MYALHDYMTNKVGPDVSNLILDYAYQMKTEENKIKLHKELPDLKIILVRFDSNQMNCAFKYKGNLKTRKELCFKLKTKWTNQSIFIHIRMCGKGKGIYVGDLDEIICKILKNREKIEIIESLFDWEKISRITGYKYKALSHKKKNYKHYLDYVNLVLHAMLYKGGKITEKDLPMYLLNKHIFENSFIYS